MRPGDIIKIKLSGDVHEAKVIDCRNKKTIWVEVLWAKTRIHALTPTEKKKIAESPTSLEGLSENEKALALLAQAGKKLVHQSGAKRIKIPRAKVINAESFQPQISQPKQDTWHLSTNTPIQDVKEADKAIGSFSKNMSRTMIIPAIAESTQTAEAPLQTSSNEQVKQETSESQQSVGLGIDKQESSVRNTALTPNESISKPFSNPEQLMAKAIHNAFAPQLSAKDRIKARLAAKKQQEE